MKVKKLIATDVEVAAIHVFLPVRYDDEDMPYDAPLRKGDAWDATIDIATGAIRNWPQGQALNFHMKVCDGGVYTLLNDGGNRVSEIEGDYVPNCIPGEWGDYVIFDIDETGTIKNWANFCTDENVEKSFMRATED